MRRARADSRQATACDAITRPEPTLRRAVLANPTTSGASEIPPPSSLGVLSDDGDHAVDLLYLSSRLSSTLPRVFEASLPYRYVPRPTRKATSCSRLYNARDACVRALTVTPVGESMLGEKMARGLPSVLKGEIRERSVYKYFRRWMHEIVSPPRKAGIDSPM